MTNQGSNLSGELDGQTLGQYKIDRQLGQGGMATVYLATQASIGRTVAIKVMPTYFMHDPNFLQRFEREVQVIARLQHPRILPVYDYGQVDRRPYIVMAYMPGGTLADLFEKGPIPLPEVARLIDQIAEGLDHAHREGVIHRDFKPSNVLLDRANNAHLADFGIAKISESTVQLTGSGVVGTPAYMAPEMASEGIVTPAVDIYALGVTLYQMLTSRYPFSGDTPLRVMMAHATEPVPDVLIARPDLPPAMAEVIRRSMAKDPIERYATAGEMASALRAAIAGQPLPAVTPPPPGADRTVIENQSAGYHPPTPTPAPAYTPAPVPAGGYTAPQGVPQQQAAYPGTGTGPYTPYPPPAAPAKKGGCSPVLIGVVIGGIVLVGCIAIAAIGGMGGLAAFMSSSTPTPVPPPPTSTTAPTDTPTNAPPPTATEPGGFTNPDEGGNDGGETDGNTGGGTGPVVFVNKSDEQVCYLYLAENNDASWGNDYLGSEQTLLPNEEATVTVSSGVYDFKAEDCDHNVVDWVLDEQIDPDSEFSILGFNAILEIENSTDDELCAVYISDPALGSWGRSLVSDTNPIAIGGKRNFAVQSGTWDLWAETCDGRSPDPRYNESLTGTTTWTITGN